MIRSLARDAMTITERQKQIDLKTTLKLNGIMTDEVIDLHQMIIGLKPTVWMSANNWKINTWFDMVETKQHHTTQWYHETSLWENGDATQFKCIGSDINGGLKLTAGWPSDQILSIHMTRYAGGHEDVFGTMSVLSLSTGCRDTMADVLVGATTTDGLWTLVLRTCITGHW
jgi:hypothetical protein